MLYDPLKYLHITIVTDVRRNNDCHREKFLILRTEQRRDVFQFLPSACACHCAKQIIEQPYHYTIYPNIRHYCPHQQTLNTKCLPAPFPCSEKYSYLVYYDRSHLLFDGEISSWCSKGITETLNGEYRFYTRLRLRVCDFTEEFKGLTEIINWVSGSYPHAYYEGLNFNFGNAAITFDTAHLHSSYFHRPSMYSPTLCRTRSQRWGIRLMPLAAPALLMVWTERPTASIMVGVVLKRLPRSGSFT